jgi:hypothetical protein
MKIKEIFLIIFLATCVSQALTRSVYQSDESDDDENTADASDENEDEDEDNDVSLSLKFEIK